MPIPIECPGCNAIYEVADDLAGKEVLCRECERRVPVEDTKGQHVSFVCPQCHEQTEVPVVWAGRWLRCPNCEALAKVPAVGGKRLTRRRVLFGVGAGLLSMAVVIGIFWPRGPSKDAKSSKEFPRRRFGEQAPGPQQGDQQPRPKGGRGRGRKGRKQQDVGPI
jgi:hypothetical protein